MLVFVEREELKSAENQNIITSFGKMVNKMTSRKSHNPSAHLATIHLPRFACAVLYSNPMRYKRVLLKLSGEQLAGDFDNGIDPSLVGKIAEEIKQTLEVGTQIVLVVGGGNMVRGANLAGNGIKRVTADQMGMLSGLINAMAVTDIFESKGISTRCLSNVFADQVAENYSYRRAIKHLEKGRVLIIAGGTGRPYFTHDTAAVALGLELDCEAVLKATKVDGVYDKDPSQHADAKHLPEMSLDEAVSDPAIRVMDKAALGLAAEQKVRVVVFDLMKTGNLQRVVNGEAVGTNLS